VADGGICHLDLSMRIQWLISLIELARMEKLNNSIAIHSDKFLLGSYSSSQITDKSYLNIMKTFITNFHQHEMLSPASCNSGYSCVVILVLVTYGFHDEALFVLSTILSSKPFDSKTISWQQCKVRDDNDDPKSTWLPCAIILNYVLIKAILKQLPFITTAEGVLKQRINGSSTNNDSVDLDTKGFLKSLSHFRVGIQILRSIIHENIDDNTTNYSKPLIQSIVENIVEILCEENIVEILCEENILQSDGNNCECLHNANNREVSSYSKNHQFDGNLLLDDKINSDKKSMKQTLMDICSHIHQL
jgi:hypothetical protein